MQEPDPPTYEESTTAGPSTQSNKAHVLDEVVKSVPTSLPIGKMPPVDSPLLTLVKLTDTELRDALYKYADGFCCYGSRFIREMILTDIYHDCAFHYKLESFGEKRDSVLQSTGYYGQAIDGTENGPTPEPWDVYVGVPTKFLDNCIATEVPHTAYVKTCTKCNGSKEVTCSSCSGWGTSSFSGSSGRGNKASGKKSCSWCSGWGKVDCSTCSGHGSLKWYRLLIVTWKNHVEDCVSNKQNLPKHVILEATGRQLLTQQERQVQPINNAPDRNINEASADLIRMHNTHFKDELVIDQRHSLRAVPFTKATYTWRNKKGEFYVYGFEKKVYFQDYPQQCCSCICC